MNDPLLAGLSDMTLPTELAPAPPKPPRPLWRAWDQDSRLVGEWDEQPPFSALAEGDLVMVDYPNGFRKSWRVYGGQLRDEMDLMGVIIAPSNPYLHPEDTTETGDRE